jgi:hypothetical protein
MKKLFWTICLLGIALTAPVSYAQSANGISSTSCSQASNTLVCTTTTTVNLPSGTNLTGMTLPQSSGVSGPGCTGLSASPSTVLSGVPTAVLLTVNGCPTTNSYTYTWAAPVATATGSSTTHAVTLSTNNPSQGYSVTVCLASNLRHLHCYLKCSINCSHPVFIRLLDQSSIRERSRRWHGVP